VISSPVQSFAYAYDLAGDPLSKTFADGTSEAYGYDQINELTSVATSSYTQTYLIASFGGRNTVRGMRWYGPNLSGRCIFRMLSGE
jgi:YD repeat-containing protein